MRPEDVPIPPAGGRRQRLKVKPGPRAAPVVSPLWKTRLCEFWKVGKCRKGGACSYAHGEEDLRISPDFERTSVCPAFLKHGHCDNPSCRYAHAVDELRVAPNLLKSKMCSFFLDGRCVVGKACRFAHSAEELAVSAELLRKAAQEPRQSLEAFQQPHPLGLVSAPSRTQRQRFVESKREEKTPSDSETKPSQDARFPQAKETPFPQQIVKLPSVDLEPMKVVVAASWEDDLQDSGEAVSSLKQRSLGRPLRSPRGEQKRARARRVLVDTLADLEEFPTAVISSTSTAVHAEDSEEKCVLVNTSPGLIDLGSRHRESVVVLDIEDAMEVCRPGSDKFEQLNLVKIHKRQRARGRSEDARRPQAGRRNAAPRSPDRRSRPDGYCQDPPGSSAAASSAAASTAPETEKMDRRGSEQDCLLCQRGASDSGTGCSRQTMPGEPCAACNCGLRVFQHNTFLTVEEEEDEEFSDLPIRRTQSM